MGPARAVGDPVLDHDDSAASAFHGRVGGTFLHGEAPLFSAFAQVLERAFRHGDILVNRNLLFPTERQCASSKIPAGWDGQE